MVAKERSSARLPERCTQTSARSSASCRPPSAMRARRRSMASATNWRWPGFSPGCGRSGTPSAATPVSARVDGRIVDHLEQPLGSRVALLAISGQRLLDSVRHRLLYNPARITGLHGLALVRGPSRPSCAPRPSTGCGRRTSCRTAARVHPIVSATGGETMARTAGWARCGRVARLISDTRRAAAKRFSSSGSLPPSAARSRVPAPRSGYPFAGDESSPARPFAPPAPPRKGRAAARRSGRCWRRTRHAPSSPRRRRRRCRDGRRCRGPCRRWSGRGRGCRRRLS